MRSDPPIVGKYVAYAVRFPAPPENARFFFGPKAFDELRAIDPELTRAINFGMFSWLAVPLLGALKWVHGFVGNWGWAIVVLTILINLAMFPLRHKSVVSMRKMQEIQPQMKAIQERYAKYKVTDPERQKMNTEVMELYKAKGVNPASGCVPMLLTLPFLFAFYSMLPSGHRDPRRGLRRLDSPTCRGRIRISSLPILMGVTMFWQTKMHAERRRSGAAEDHDVHAADVHVHVSRFPSGLVIYWLVSNLWTIGQQYFTNYLIGAPARPVQNRPLKTPRAAEDTDTHPHMATADITAFVQKVVDAMGLDLEAAAEEMPDGVRINLDGEDGNILIRRQGEALAALQHIVAAVYPPRGDRRPPAGRRLHGLSQGQGRGAAADGDVPGGKAKTPAWRRRSARSIRTSAASSTWPWRSSSRCPPRASATRSRRRSSSRSSSDPRGCWYRDRFVTRVLTIDTIDAIATRIRPQRSRRQIRIVAICRTLRRCRGRHRRASDCAARGDLGVGRVSRPAPSVIATAHGRDEPFEPRHATVRQSIRRRRGDHVVVSRSFDAPALLHRRRRRRDLGARQSGCAHAILRARDRLPARGWPSPASSRCARF